MNCRLLAVSTVLCLGCAATDLTWTPIHWESAKIGDRTVDKAAMFVPVQLDGKSAKVLLQLDLGADLTQLESVPYDQLFGKGSAPKDKPRKLPINGVIGGVRVNDCPMDVVPENGAVAAPGKPVMLGTLGADFFQKRILLMDFIRQQITILGEGAALPDGLELAATFVPLTIRDGKIMVPIAVNGRPHNDFFYDTGASLFPLATTAGRWKTMTARTGTEPDNQIWKVPSWGKEAIMVGAPIAGAIQVGKARLEHPTVFFESSGIPDLAGVNLFGNALFFDRFMVIVDIPGKRFGLIPRN